MKNVAMFDETEKNVQLTLTFLIPKKEGEPVGSDFDLDKTRQRAVARMLDIIGAFSRRIIASLERRVQACQRLLIAHLEDVEYNDGCHICWCTKDGKSGYFNVPSFNMMLDCIESLERGSFERFINSKGWIDQTIKALLNDTEQDHSDAGGFKYSELVSILCELQACPTECLPK